MLNWLRGLALLRYPALVRELGERRFHLQRIEALRGLCPGSKISNDVRLLSACEGHLHLGRGATLGRGPLAARRKPQPPPVPQVARKNADDLPPGALANALERARMRFALDAETHQEAA